MSAGEMTAVSARASTKDMVFVEGGTFTMGSDRHYPEEAPARRMTVGGFWIDPHPVTNDQFRSFISATGYRTAAERTPDASLYPGAAPHLLRPASVVFVSPPHPVGLHDHMRWWRLLPGASWKRPRGPGSSLRGLGDHPVVHLAWDDAIAYTRWAGKDLPTEAEWEFAARGGLEGTEYAWGHEFTPGGKHMANTWQGDFPINNTLADGYPWTSPVGAFPANGYGLHDMIGNVWEWTADAYTRHRQPEGGACCGAPSGPQIAEKVIKGGSHLCSPNYCRRYRPAARMAQPVDTGTSHLGLRCVMRAGA